LDGVRNEVRETIDRHRHADERIVALLVETSHPGRDGGSSEKEASSGLLGRPSASGLERENRETLVRGIVRSVARGDASHPGVLDAELLAQQRNLGAKDVAFGNEAYAGDAAVDAPAAHVGEHEVCERDDVDHR
jgi:hypothetical protein